MENFRLASGVFAAFYLFCEFAYFKQIAIENIVQKRAFSDCRLSCKTSRFTLCDFNDFFYVFSRLRTALDLLDDAVSIRRIVCFTSALFLTKIGSILP